MFNTHIEISPYNEENSIPILEEMYIYEDKFTMKPVACGYIIDNGTLYLAKGTPLSLLQGYTGVVPNCNHRSDPESKMSKEHVALYEPRNELQEKSIEFLTESKEKQLGLNLKTGFGKSYVCISSVTKLNKKAIVITHNEGIKQQWINTCNKMFDYKAHELMNISGGAIMEAIMNNEVPEADIYFVNHSTLRNYLTQYNGYMLHLFFKKLKVGIKIYDEAHLEFANILMIDFFSNTNRNWYVTATFDRSDKGESRCFKRAFSALIPFGEIESNEAVEKHVIYHVVNINSKASPKEKSKIAGFRGMTAASYAHYAFERDEKDTGFRTALMLLDKIKEIEGKTLIFVPLIEICELFVNKIRPHTNKSIAAYHSQISKDEKEDILKKDIIVSTIKSMGVGRDLKGLRNIICLEPIASKVVATQLIGRLRPYAPGLDTYFFDIVDTSIPPLNWWFRARMKVIPDIVKQIVYLNIDE